MTIDNLFLVRPNKEIKYLLKLRGSNLKRIAEQTNVSYTVLSKFLSNGDKRAHLYQQAPHIYKALAEAIGIKESGLMDRELITTLIDAELQKVKNAELAKKRHFSIGEHRWSFKRFIKNLIRLGKPGYYMHYKKNEE